MNSYTIIMSGGRGKRFWPLSQEALPKQFLSFDGKGTLFQQTYQRLRELMPTENIFTVTRQSYESLVLEQVKEFVPRNIIVEPRQCNTAPCIALGTAYILHQDADATILALPADQYIIDEKQFISALDAGFTYAQQRREIVTFGIRPDSPHTGYGYIQVGDVAEQINGFSVHHGKRFVEKPDLEQAKRLVASKEFYWNGGIFCAQADVLFDAIHQKLPIIHEDIGTFQANIGMENEQAALVKAYTRMPNISIDHGVMEHIAKFAVIPIDVGWNDLGSWESLRRLTPPDENSNLLLGDHLVERVRGTTVIGPNQIIVIGLDNVIVASNGTYILVCAREQEHLIQVMVDRLERASQ